MGNILDPGAPVISSWAPTHGFEAIFYWKNLVLGVAVLFLARTMASLYFLDNIKGGEAIDRKNRRSVLVNGAVFVVFFLFFLALLLTTRGQQAIAKDGTPQLLNAFEWVDYKYLHNFIHMWWIALVFLIGVVMVLYAVIRASFSKTFTKGIWFAGGGVILVVMSLFWIAAFNGTPYYPSLLDTSSSLSIYNSSSSKFTLEVMSVVSLIVPFVAGYIAYVWHSMDRKPITPAEMDSTSDKY